MLRFLWRLVGGVLVLIGLGVIFAGIALWRSGISAKGSPGPVETTVARRLRSMAIPASARSRINPVQPTAEIIEGGMEHYADHCAICHANDGSGVTAIGRGLYPKAPDLRLDPTQSLTDGELFYIIENGVRFTGMPAWGNGTHDGEASWHLVHFIRRLPKLTKEDLAKMAGMNPKSAAEWREEEAARRSLEGSDTRPKSSPTRHTHPARRP
jgi:mono/diheme cytochrome c family protein